MNRRAFCCRQRFDGDRRSLGLGEQDAVNRIALAGEADTHSIGGLSFRSPPRARFIDGLAVDREPLAQRSQAVRLDFGNLSIRHGTHVEQKVTVLAHNVDEQVNELIRCDGLLGVLDLVITEGVAQAAGGSHFSCVMSSIF